MIRSGREPATHCMGGGHANLLSIPKRYIFDVDSNFNPIFHDSKFLLLGGGSSTLFVSFLIGIKNFEMHKNNNPKVGQQVEI